MGTHITNDFYKLEAKKNEPKPINYWIEHGFHHVMYDNGNVFYYLDSEHGWIAEPDYFPKPLPHHQEDLKHLFEGDK